MGCVAGELCFVLFLDLIQSARARVNQTCDVKDRPASSVSAQCIIIVRGVLRGKCDISVGCS